MAGEQNERLPSDRPSFEGKGDQACGLGIDASRAFGFYLVAGILVALVIAGLVFVFQR